MNWGLIFELAELSTTLIRQFHDEDKQPEVDKVLRLVGVAGRLGKELQLDQAEFAATVALAEDGVVSDDIVESAHSKLRDTLSRF